MRGTGMVFGLVLLFANGFCGAADETGDTTPAVSTYAPAEILADQIRGGVRTIGRSVRAEKDYRTDTFRQNAATLAVMAMTLGMSDEPSDLKPATPALVKAAMEAVNATDYTTAKKAAGMIVDAMDTSDEAALSEMRWRKVCDIAILMKKVPLVDTRMRRELRKGKTEQATVLAAIAQVAAHDTSLGTTPEEKAEWVRFSEMMRDRAAVLPGIVGDGDEDALEEAQDLLTESCDLCHEGFQVTVE
ncbi:MAG: hypothetical protein Q4C47_02470 [Planctomycetia bacterium]|nr:hypothetical protein [Planctomycetia bacterium]